MPIRVRVSSSGRFKSTKSFFDSVLNRDRFKNLDSYGQKGVDALFAATPKYTGETALSWGYEISKNSDETEICWTNDNVNKGCNVALLIQYGHGTGTGGYVPPVDYINPAMTPVLKEIGDEVWMEVTNR